MHMLMPRPLIPCLGLTILLGVGVVGCQSKYANIPAYVPSTQPLSATGLTGPTHSPLVDALVAPPAGWVQDEPKTSDKHSHQVWKSPTGATAYGVIHFGLPLPVPASWVLPSYLSAMKESEGEATVIGQPLKDDALPGIRFTVDCGDYRMRTNLICKGFGGWAVYTGTLRDRPEVPAEVELAERARDKTQVGVSGPTSEARPIFTRPTASATE
jgi:hypothetical protein